MIRYSQAIVIANLPKIDLSDFLKSFTFSASNMDACLLAQFGTCGSAL